MTWGTCAGCTAKDSEIAHLRELVESLRKENLNLVDARAASATFPRAVREPQAQRAEPEPPLAVSPAQVRETEYFPPISPEKLEELYDLQNKVEGDT